MSRAGPRSKCNIYEYMAAGPLSSFQTSGKEASIMSVEFYDVKNRTKVSLEEAQIKKTSYTSTTKNGSERTRYAFRGKLPDGRNVTKFCSKSD